MKTHWRLQDVLAESWSQGNRIGHGAKAQGHGLQDKSSTSKYRDSNNAHDPVDARPRSPSKQEQSRRQQHDRKQGWNQSVLLCTEAVPLDVGLEIEPDVRAIDNDANHGANHNTCKDDALLAEVKTIVANIDERERLEVGIVDPVDERGVQVREQYRGILDADLRRDEEGIIDDFADGFLALVNFGL